MREDCAAVDGRTRRCGPVVGGLLLRVLCQGASSSLGDFLLVECGGGVGRRGRP